jgi:hypothetical protein
MRSSVRGGPAEPPPARGRGERWKTAAAWLVAVLAVMAVWRTRVAVTHAIPNWDSRDARGLMKSDPALLYWFTQRIAENGGRIPSDLAHTRAVQWPDEVDARVEFPQAQMWLAASTWRWLGGEQPLHEWCVTLFSLLAATTGLAVFGLARELTRSRALALVALGSWCLLPASWRTTGFVLLGEDLSFPAFVTHLWLLARAARVRTAAAFLLAGLFLALAMASWHAAGFFVALEAGAFLAWTLRSGENPLRVRHAWLVLLPLALGCLLEPMLRGKLQIASLPMQLAGVLGGLAWLERRRALGLPLRAALAAGLLVLAAGAALLASRAVGGGLGDYSHVFGLVAAKLRHLGRLPADPERLPFEVRILWQGPFDTFPASELALRLNAALAGFALLALVSLPTWWRGRGRSTEALLALLGAAALLASWLILRTAILAAVLLPVASVLVAARWRPGREKLVGALAAAALLVPPWLPLRRLSLREFLRSTSEQNAWYNPDHVRELRQTLGAIRELVPEGEPVSSDEVNSTAILAHTAHPILVQPKYESKLARERLAEFRHVATLGTPAELARYLREHRTRYLVYDWRTLWANRYQAGIPESVNGMRPGTALSQRVSDPQRLEGFELLWKSRGGRFALYRLAGD